MLKFIFLSLVLSNYAFAADALEKKQEVFKESKLLNKSEKEDNINVLPFYTVKELKDSKKESLKLNQDEIKTLDQFKTVLNDKKKKLEDAEFTMQYFNELYMAKKLDKDRALVELKWSLRVIAKRKDAIVKLTKKYKNSMDLSSLGLDQYEGEIATEQKGRELIDQIQSKTVENKLDEKEAVSKTVAPTGLKVTGNIQKDQKAAYNFYKDKTFLDTKSKDKQSLKVEKPVEPQMEVQKIEEQSKNVASVDEVIPSIAISLPKEDVIADKVESKNEDVSLKEIPKNETTVASVKTEVLEKKDSVVNDIKPNVPDTKIEAKQDLLDHLEKAVPETKESVIMNAKISNPDKLQETVEIVNLKMEQQRKDQELKELQEKYKKLEEEKKALEVKQDNASKVEQKVEQKLSVTVVDEEDSSAKSKDVSGKVKINSIKEQINENNSLESRIKEFANEQDVDDVQYYKGSGLEEDGVLEEGDGPAY